MTRSPGDWRLIFSTELEPCHLVTYHGNWYLLALSTAAGRIETLVLSRCRSIEEGKDSTTFRRDNLLRLSLTAMWLFGPIACQPRGSHNALQ